MSKHVLALTEIPKLIGVNPANRFGIKNKGALKVGYDADLVFVDLNEEFILQAEDLFYKHKASPFIGRKYKGKVNRTILRGNTIFDNGKIVSEPIGKFLRP